jgi:rubrerythrin
MFNNVDFDMEQLNQFIEKIDAHIISKEPVSLENAVKFAIELELDAFEHHYKTLIIKSNPEVGELINRLGTSEKEHFDRLKILCKQKGYLD